MRICFKVIWHMLGNEVHKKKCKHNFSSLDFKNWVFISSVLQFTSFKSHGGKVQVTCFHTPSQGCLPEKTRHLNPKSSQGRHRRTGEGKTLYSEGNTAATSSVKSIFYCLSQFSGCLRDPELPISSLFWHIYIGSGSAQCVTSGMSRWNPPLLILRLQMLKATQSSLI